MAVALLNGLYAAIGFSLGGTTINCTVRGWRAQINRDDTEQTTMCSTNWISNLMGRVQVVISLDGPMTTGGPYSDPLAYITSQTPIAFVATADTGATLSGNGLFTSDTESIQKGRTAEQSNTSKSTTLKSQGAVTSVWPVT